MTAKDRMPSIPTSEKNGISAALEENTAKMAELVGVIRELKEAKTGHGNGNGKAWDLWRILIGLALTIAMGAHALLWYLDKTVAVQTEQIERSQMDIQQNGGEIRQHIRDHTAR